MMSENATKTISSSKQEHYSAIRQTEQIAATATATVFRQGERAGAIKNERRKSASGKLQGRNYTLGSGKNGTTMKGCGTQRIGWVEKSFFFFFQ